LSETRAFPSEKTLSVPNLLSFIVANLEPEARLKLGLSLCGDDCIQVLNESYLADFKSWILKSLLGDFDLI
jgi:hypothetical protein